MFDEKQNQKDICRALAWQHGDKDAAEALLKQYQPLIRSIRRNFCQGLSYEDLEQELILHFLEQTACYDPKKNPSFAGYITPRLRWYRMNRIRKEMTREDHEELTLEDQAEGTSLDDYGEAKATLEEVARLACLTKKQKPVFFLWMQGLTPMEISAPATASRPSQERNNGSKGSFPSMPRRSGDWWLVTSHSQLLILNPCFHTFLAFPAWGRWRAERAG